MKIPLFDIDWTVLDKDPKRNIHHEAFSYAYDKVYGVSNPKEINVEGKIDNQIIMETMVLNGVPEDVSHISYDRVFFQAYKRGASSSATRSQGFTGKAKREKSVDGSSDRKCWGNSMGKA